MNRRRLLMIGIVALFAAGAVSLLAYKLLQASVVRAQVSGVEILTAAEDISIGSRIEAKDLRQTRMPAGSVPENAFRTPAEAVGRGVITPIARNEVITAAKVAGVDAGSGMSSIIPDGMRAVSVKVNDVVAVAGFVVPGTHVDVLLTGNPDRMNDPARVMTTTVLQNVLVLAAGTKLQNDSHGQPQSVPIITLLVSPADGQRLTLASSEGRIQLALRNPLDRDHAKTVALRNATLYDQQEPRATVLPQKHRANTPRIAELPAYMIETIRGTKRESQNFR